MSSGEGKAPLPLRTINHLEEGESIVYRPILRASEKRRGEVAIVLVPAVKRPDEGPLEVLEPKRADLPEQWQVPSKSSVAAFVYGPTGLSAKKVKRFLSKDQDLVAQLADYAEKTQQTEALLQALTSDDSSGQTVNAAFRGFASQYGFSTSMDKTQPTDQQMGLALRTLNPAMAAYDPISPQPSAGIGQTASLATSIAALFFGSPVGLAAGGTAMLMQMHSLVFPDTVFRSSLALPVPDDGLGLCGKRDAVAAHTKVAYLWATRIPNIGAPQVKTDKTLSLAVGQKASVPVSADDKDWKYLDRARKWALEPTHVDGKPVLVPVREMADPKALEVDLTKVKVSPGDYNLVANWDWNQFAVKGIFRVEALSDFAKARLEAGSQDRLVAHSGKVQSTLNGADFEFVTKVELAKPGDKFFLPVTVPFALPDGFREGVQEHMDIQINTGDLDAGDYRLMITQADGKPHPAPMAILPAPPKIDNLPVLISHGDSTHEVTLKGERLNLLAEMKSPEVNVHLDPANPDGTERRAVLHLNSDVAAGESLDLKAFVENRSQPLDLKHAVEVLGPRPQITESKLSLPPGLSVVMRAGELPGSYSLTALLRVTGVGDAGSLALQCKGEEQTPQVLKIGTRSGKNSLERLGPDQLFLTFDDGTFPTGCELTATPMTASPAVDGSAYALGRIVRIPKLEHFIYGGLQRVHPPAEENPLYTYVLTGSRLETIERIGWDPDHGYPLNDLPSVIPDRELEQSLQVQLPVPPGANPCLYVWLRGESTGRATTILLDGDATN